MFDFLTFEAQNRKSLYEASEVLAIYSDPEIDILTLEPKIDIALQFAQIFVFYSNLCRTY